MRRRPSVDVVSTSIQRFYVNYARTRDRYLLIFYVSIWPSYIGSVIAAYSHVLKTSVCRSCDF